MLYISSALKKIPGLNVVCLNLNLRPGGIEAHLVEIMSIIELEKIDAVFSGGRYYDFEAISRIFGMVKQYNPAITTVTGGPLVSGDPPVAMDVISQADYGIIGEGERTITELVLALMNKISPDKIRGLIMRSKTGWLITEAREPIEDWTREIFWPDYEGFGLKEIAKGAHPLNDNIIHLTLSRGCPFSCTFCCNSIGTRYRQRPVEDFIEELHYLRSISDNLNITLADDLLADSKVRLKAVCQATERIGFHHWRASARVNQVNQEMANTLKQGGCVSVCLGLESVNTRVLKSMNKKTNFAQAEEALHILADAGLEPYGYFIFGDVEETWESAMETLEWWDKHPDYAISLGPIRHFPGTTIYRQAVARGMINPHEHLRQWLPVINDTRMSNQQHAELLAYVSNKQRVRLEDKHSTRYLRLTQMRFDSADLSMEFSGQCPHCGQELSHTCRVVTLAYFGCPHCHKFIHTPKPTAAVSEEMIAERLDEIVDHYGQVAFWGLGHIFRSAISPGVASRHGIRLIDQNSGWLYGSKTVESDKIDMDDDLRFIIVSAAPDSIGASTIFKQIQGLPKVEKVLHLYQLFDVQFSI